MHGCPGGNQTGRYVRDDGLLLDVADKAVAHVRRDEVGHEEHVEEDSLCGQDAEAEQGPGVGQGQRDQQVHPFLHS